MPGSAGGTGFTGNPGQDTPFGGAGGGGAGGGAGGTNLSDAAIGGNGGTSGSPNGGNGQNGNLVGASGGGGGYNGNGAGASSITTSAPLTGGSGGTGGFGLRDAGGGGGGAGGYGAIVTGAAPSSNSSTITGGTGGAGGGAAGGASGGGNGGDGGVGVQFTATGATFTNSGTITGGNGGAGGFNTGGGTNGNPGAGGAGIVGAGLAIINSGTITGGLSGDGFTSAASIVFTGGTNSLALQAGSNVSGNVVAFSTADTLALGGATNSTFNTTLIGPAGQYRGFGIFNKTGTSTWTLTGTPGQTTPWVISGGTLAAGASTNVFGATSAITVTSPGALDLGGFNQTIGSLTGSGSVTNSGVASNAVLSTGADNTSTTFSGTIQNGASMLGLTKLGNGTFTLSGLNNYTGATTVAAGTLQAGSVSGLASGSAFTVGTSGATAALDLNGFNSTIGSLAGNASGIVTNSSGTAATLSTGGNNASTTFAGTIANGAGITALTKQGSGTFTLSGNNTYTGATTVAAGTLQAGSVTGFASGSAFTVGTSGATATLDLKGFSATIGSLAGNSSGSITNSSGTAVTLSTGGNNASTNFAGAIADGAGPIGLTKLGSGTFTLSGINSYTGATTVTTGTLQAGSATGFASGSAFTVGTIGTTATLDLNGLNAAIGSLAGNSFGLVTNSGTSSPATLTVGGDNSSTTFSGVIQNGASPIGLTKQGSGTFTLGGTDSYTGATIINGGTLFVTSSIATSATFVNSGGMLAGTGTVGNVTVNNGGSFAPGPAGTPGLMVVSGNLTFASGGVFLVQVAPTNASIANVTGTATLTGNVQTSFSPGTYLVHSYTILTADGIFGTFSSVSGNVPAGFHESLSYVGNTVDLNLTLQTAGPSGSPGQSLGLFGGLNGNQLNVVNAIGDFFNNGGKLPPGFVSVFGLTGGNFASALTELSGESATGAQQSAFQLTTGFLGLMTDPFSDGRGGPGGGVSFYAADDSERSAELASAFDAVTKTSAPGPTTFAQRWNSWGSAFGGASRIAGDPSGSGSQNLSARAGGFAAGADYQMTPFTALGFALAGGATGWSLTQGSGSGDAFQAGVYGKTGIGPAYLAGSLAFAEHWMSTDRTSFAASQLTAKFTAQSYGGRVEAGYRFAAASFGIAPYAAANAQAFVIPSYSETDSSGGGFGLNYGGRSSTDLRGETGARFDQAIVIDPTALLTLRGKLGYAHDWISDPSLAATFQALPGASFIVNGATPPHNSGLASAGAELRFASGLSIAAKFDGEFAAQGQTYAGTATARWIW